MGLLDTMYYYWNEMADSRTKDWPLINSPYPVTFIILAYVYFVLGYGPRYMRNRPAYSLKTFIKCYDIFQVIANGWVVYSFIDAGWFTELSIYCEPGRYTYERGPYKIATTMWWLLLLKIIDLIETAVFVLRKKNKQISFLHLYHHISTLLLTWIALRYIAVAMSSFPSLVNAIVHVVMYTYYFLSTFGPAVNEVIVSYKPLLTVLQMIQIVGLTVYSLQTLLPSCNVPKWPGPIFVANLLANLLLFMNFYRKSYEKSKNKSK